MMIVVGILGLIGNTTAILVLSRWDNDDDNEHNFDNDGDVDDNFENYDDIDGNFENNGDIDENDTYEDVVGIGTQMQS